MISNYEFIQGILLGLLLVILYTWYYKENYVSKREKAQTIHGWWNNTSSPSYEKYKSDIKGSDVVEYSAVKKMHKTGGATVDSIENVIS